MPAQTSILCHCGLKYFFLVPVQYGNNFAVLWIRLRADQEFLPEPEKIITRFQKTYIYTIYKQNAQLKKSSTKIQFNLYIVVISAMKCEFAVQLSHGGDRFTDNNTGSGSETHFKVGSETGAEKNHSRSTTSHRCTGISTQCTLCTSVADPDPHVFALLDPDPLVRGMDQDPDTALLLFDFLSLKNDIKVASKSNLQKTFF